MAKILVFYQFIKKLSPLRPFVGDTFVCVWDCQKNTSLFAQTELRVLNFICFRSKTSAPRMAPGGYTPQQQKDLGFSTKKHHPCFFHKSALFNSLNITECCKAQINIALQTFLIVKSVRPVDMNVRMSVPSKRLKTPFQASQIGC